MHLDGQVLLDRSGRCSHLLYSSFQLLFGVSSRRLLSCAKPKEPRVSFRVSSEQVMAGSAVRKWIGGYRLPMGGGAQRRRRLHREVVLEGALRIDRKHHGTD